HRHRTALYCVAASHFRLIWLRMRDTAKDFSMAQELARDQGCAPPKEANQSHLPKKTAFAALALGSLGVIYGDIGTSPLYALRASLNHFTETGVTETGVLGTVSLLIWALFFTVTAKYVLFLMHADNKGEGGTLSLMALAHSALGRRGASIFLLGV